MLWAKLCVPLPKFPWWSPKQCDCIWSKDAIRLNEVLRVKAWSFKIRVIKRRHQMAPPPSPSLPLSFPLFYHTTYPPPAHTVCEHTAGPQLMDKPGREFSTETKSAATFIWDPPASRTGEVSFCCSNHPEFVAFCYSSPSGLRHSVLGKYIHLLFHFIL